MQTAISELRRTRRGALQRGALAGASALATAAVTAACGGQNAGRSDAQPAASQQPVTLSFLASSTGAEKVQRLNDTFALFTKQHPSITVQVGLTPSGQTEQSAILVRAQSGDPADAVEWPTYWHGFLTAGAVIDLTDRYKREKLDTGKFLPEHVANITVDGKLYGVPISVSADGWAYNLDLLQEAGLQPPPANPDDRAWTMERFFEYAQKLTRAGERWGFGGTHSGGGTFYHDATFFGMGPWDEKTRTMTVDMPLFRKGLEFWRDLATQYRYQPSPDESKQITPPGQNVFLSGKIALQDIFTGLTPSFKWGLATLPNSGSGRNVAGRLGLHSVYLGPGRKVDAAWTLAAWFAQPEPGGRAVWSLGHAVSPQVDAKASDFPQQVWRDSYRVDPKALLLQSRYSKRARWGLSTLKGWDDVDTQIQALYTRFRAGEISTSDFAGQAQRLGTQAIAASK
jgi:ABC-type glycerol-3-phosphate transport system substrate-binding protein